MTAPTPTITRSPLPDSEHLLPSTDGG